MRIGTLLLGFWYVTVLAWWGLAFAPGDDPSLLAAREVCFGTFESGLPGAAGWLSLSSPLLMVLALLALWGSEIREDLRRVPRGVLIVALLIPALGLSYVASRVVQASQVDFSRPATLDPLPEEYPRTDKPLPSFSLVDQHGAPVESALIDEPTVITFAFAHCQTICPTLVQQVKDSGVERVLVITLDPWRDTPSALPTLAQQWELPANVRVASGSVEAVQQVIADFGVGADRDEKTGDIVHPGLVFVTDGAGNIAYTFNNPPAAWLAEAVERAR